ncbi:MAG: NADH-quinone oxidoreductase subunit J [Vampirovibrionales bacterium]
MSSSLLTLEGLLFGVLTFTSLGGALGVVLAPSIVYSALALLIVFLSMAGFFVLNNADFLAIVQVMVYAVGLTIVLLFGLMLTGNQPLPKKPTSPLCAWLAGLGLTLITTMLVALVQTTPVVPHTPDPTTIHVLMSEGTLRSLGQLLFTQYLLPFEVASVLLLGATIGALVLARRHDEEAHPRAIAEGETR